MSDVPAQQALIERAFGVYNEGGPSAFLDHLTEIDAIDPDFAMEIQHDAPNGGVWRGREGFEEMARLWLEAWEEFEVFPEEPIEIAGDLFLVPVRQRVVARGSGIELDGQFFYTVELADDRFRRIGLYTERSLAEQALAER